MKKKRFKLFHPQINFISGVTNELYLIYDVPYQLVQLGSDFY